MESGCQCRQMLGSRAQAARGWTTMPADLAHKINRERRSPRPMPGNLAHKNQSRLNSNIYPHSKKNNEVCQVGCAIIDLCRFRVRSGNVGPRELGKISHHPSTVIDRLRPTWLPNRSFRFVRHSSRRSRRTKPALLRYEKHPGLNTDGQQNSQQQLSRKKQPSGWWT